MNNETDKSPIEKEAEKIVNALKNNRGLIIDEIKNLKTAVDERNEKGFKQKLPFLIGHLTKVSKRKTLEGRFNGYKLGLNCNGLGHENKWGSQLNPFSDPYNKDDKMLLGILRDDDLSLEISQEIVSSNRTNFLKLVNHLKKISMPTKEIDDIKINDKVDIVFDGAEPSILINGEEMNDKILTEQFKILYNNKYEFSLRDFLDAEIVKENAPSIAEAIKKATKQIKELTKQEIETGQFVNELAKVYETMKQI